MANPSNNSISIEQIDKAISLLKRSKKKKLTISSIAEKAGIERRTIYNRPDLKERCLQAIGIQQEIDLANKELAASQEPKKKRTRLSTKEKIQTLQEQLEDAKTVVKQVLEQNRNLVLEKQELISTITILQEEIAKLKEVNASLHKIKVLQQKE